MMSRATKVMLSTAALLLGCGIAACDDNGTPGKDTGKSWETAPPQEAGVDGSAAEAGSDGPAAEAGIDGPAPDGKADGSAPDGAPDGQQSDASLSGTWITISAGTFTMGSPTTEPCRDSTDEDEHKVTLSKSFEIYSIEVTQTDFLSLMGYNPSSNTACGGTCPAENMHWSEAASYCNALSDTKSLARCYTCTGSGTSVACDVDPAYLSTTKTIYNCPGYRLPTEAEWEYAYRATSTTSLYNGTLPAASCSASDPLADAIGWYSKNSSSKTQPVAGKLKNTWGLYDMAGNAQEWVNDRHQQSLGTTAVTDPVGPSSGLYGVIRGGSFAHSASDLRAAHRKMQTLKNKGTSLGVRCVRTLVP